MDTLKCQWCENVFSTKSYLSKHQRTAKYCLKIQEEKKSCELCGKKEPNHKCHLILKSDVEKITNEHLEYIKALTEMIYDLRRKIVDGEVPYSNDQSISVVVETTIELYVGDCGPDEFTQAIKDNDVTPDMVTKCLDRIIRILFNGEDILPTIR